MNEMTEISKSRMQILDRIAEGSLSAEEGARMLESLGKKITRSVKASRISPSSMVVVRVINRASDEVMVDLRLPVSLVSTARKLGARLASNLEGINVEKILTDLQSGQAGDRFRIECEKEIIEIVVE
jgi:hypothetical protein